MENIELLNEIVEELEADEREAAADLRSFREQYDLLIDCTVDELNDEILRLNLGGREGGVYMLMQDGKHQVYRKEILSSEIFIGGEEFALRCVERGVDTGKEKSLINFLFEPTVPTSYTHLVIPYDKVFTYMDKSFGQMVALHLLPSMNETEKQVLALQHEMAERHRQREIKRTQDVTVSVYQHESSW